MKVKDLIIMGLRNLFRRKARTSLTVMGMAVGIILIMILASISIGIRMITDRSIMENGQMSIINISKYSGSFDEEGNYQEKTQIIDDRLLETIKGMDHVRAASPRFYANLQLETGKYMGGLYVTVMDTTTFSEFDFPELEYGSYPTEENREGIILGSQASAYFYDPMSWGRGQEPEIDMQKDRISFYFSDYAGNISKNKNLAKFPLINVAKMAATENYLFQYDSYMDIEYYKTLITRHANTLTLEYRKQLLDNMKEYESIMINVDDMRNVTKVQEEIEALGFETSSDMQYIQPMIDAVDMLQKVLIGIGLVAMLVAAINIANTMIMSIYERTKEIGIMKVLGCLIFDVKKLFLFESAVLGLIGGLFGVAFSYLFSFLINKYGSGFLGSLIQVGIEQGDKPSVIPWWLPVFISIFAMFIGVISGYMPARRATRISAIEAMKSEN